jgi:hypothetical protein
MAGCVAIQTSLGVGETRAGSNPVFTDENGEVPEWLMGRPAI